MKILLSALVAGLSMAALPALAAELAPIAPMVPTTSVVPTTPMAQISAAAPAQPKIARQCYDEIPKFNIPPGPSGGKSSVRWTFYRFS